MQNKFQTEFGLHGEVYIEEGFFATLSADIIGRVMFK